MAFIGTPIVTQVTQNCFRISGVTLGAFESPNESGLIRFAESLLPNSDVELVAPNWEIYTYEDHNVSLIDQVQVTVNDRDGFGVKARKTGTTKADFSIQVQNMSNLASGQLEIYVSKAS